MTIQIQTRQLTEPILDSGIQNTNYFNGRILAAGDLRTDQEANREQHEQLGLGLGAGVVRGLEVTLIDGGSGGKAPVVGVTRGLAFNGNGQAVALPLDVRVAFSLPPAPLPVGAGLFGDCMPLSTASVPLAAGFYILTAAPASGFSGQAPMYDFGGGSTANNTVGGCGCGSRYAVEGVSFGLVNLDVSALKRLSQATQDAIAALMQKTDAASVSQLRNWMAHICFGTEEVAGFGVNPFPPQTGPSPYVSYGAIDALAASGTLTSFDVPLALLYWTVQGVRFLDLWSVRRRLTHGPVTEQWPLLTGNRRRSEAEAMFLQFQDQILEIDSTDPNPGKVVASQYFRYLPPVGFIPLAGAGGSTGFDYQTFFQLSYHDPVFVSDARGEPIARTALCYPAINLQTSGAVWLYQPVHGTNTLSYLIFTSIYAPFQGEARFDAASWGYANFV